MENILNQIKGNPAPLLVSGIVGYLISEKIAGASTSKKILVTAGVAIAGHFIYVGLTSKKNELIIKAELPPVQGVKQTK